MWFLCLPQSIVYLYSYFYTKPASQLHTFSLKIFVHSMNTQYVLFNEVSIFPASLESHACMRLILKKRRKTENYLIWEPNRWLNASKYSDFIRFTHVRISSILCNDTIALHTSPIDLLSTVFVRVKLNLEICYVVIA